ncbi:hypothetical protein ABZ016_19910 [Streptomyces sp. NPDC006372]|uniref:hypothetical protein n=1 Tax=Streptomyces sp. NPDC006372 TaxID=3155599 RepID=UPI0033B913D1
MEGLTLRVPAMPPHEARSLGAEVARRIAAGLAARPGAAPARPHPDGARIQVRPGPGLAARIADAVLRSLR